MSTGTASPYGSLLPTISLHGVKPGGRHSPPAERRLAGAKVKPLVVEVAWYELVELQVAVELPMCDLLVGRL